MSLKFFLLINTLTYFFSLCILNKVFINKYIYPFRTLEIITFFINLFIFVCFSFFYYNANILIAIIIINLNFFYIFFHIQNMINTSPRTKILLTLIKNKFNMNIYNEKIILKNRLKRLISNNQIILKNNFIEINKKKKIFLFVNFLFSLIKKI